MRTLTGRPSLDAGSKRARRMTSLVASAHPTQALFQNKGYARPAVTMQSLRQSGKMLVASIGLLTSMWQINSNHLSYDLINIHEWILIVIIKKGQVSWMNSKTQRRFMSATQYEESVDARHYAFLCFLTLLNVMNFVDRQLLSSFANFIVPDLELSNTQFGLLTGLVFITLEIPVT